MWQMQFEGSRAAVKKAVDSYVLPVSTPAVEASAEETLLESVKGQLVAFIDLLPATQNGVCVNAAGSGAEVILISVEGRVLTL